MPISVVTPASQTDFTTVTRAVEELGISYEEAAQNRTLLRRLISRASDTIRTCTDREFAQEKVEESLTVITPSPRLILTRSPLVTIHTVEYDGQTIDAGEYMIENADSGFLYLKEGRTWSSTSLTGGLYEPRRTRYGRYEIKATYTGGYQMPTDSSAGTLPADLERAAIELVASYFHSRAINPNITRERIGEASVSYTDSGPGGIPVTAHSIIEKYRRIE
jgi:hypothetical protein